MYSKHFEKHLGLDGYFCIPSKFRAIRAFRVRKISVHLVFLFNCAVVVDVAVNVAAVSAEEIFTAATSTTATTF